MKTTKILLTAIMSMFLVFGINAQSFTTYQVKYRGPDMRIDQKIKRGIRSGELTKREVKDLKHEYRKIEMMKRKAWRNGHLNRHEERRINHAMQDFNRLLDRYLHNRKDRKYRYDHQRDRYDNDWRWNDNDEYDYYHKKKRNRH